MCAIWLLAALLAGVSACGKQVPATAQQPTAATTDTEVGTLPGAKAPMVSLLDARGKIVELGDLRGKVVLLNFWATWCGPCIDEMPSLQELHDAMQKEGLLIVAASVDQTALEGFGYAKGESLTLQVVFDPDANAARTFAVRQIPMTFLIDRDGIIRSRFRGSRDWNTPEMRDEIRSWL